MDLRTTIIGDPAVFAIEARDVDERGMGFFSMRIGDHTLGDSTAVTQIAIQGTWLGATLPFVTSGWPDELAHVAGPRALKLLSALFVGVEGAAVPSAQIAASFGLAPSLLADADFTAYLRAFTTDALGPPFDGFFCILRPNAGNLEIVHDLDMSEIRVERVEISIYEGVMARFADTFGVAKDIDRLSEGFQRRRDAYRSRSR